MSVAESKQNVPQGARTAVASLFSNVSLEELDYTGERLHRKLMPAGVDIGHQLNAIDSRLGSLQTVDPGFGRISLETFSRQFDADLLTLEPDQLIVLTRDDVHRFRKRILDKPAARTCARTKRRQPVSYSTTHLQIVRRSSAPTHTLDLDRSYTFVAFGRVPHRKT